jgi:hypothetical protein
MGVAIWDAQFRAAAWRTPEVWQMLNEIRSGGDALTTGTQRNKEPEKQRRPDEK